MMAITYRKATIKDIGILIKLRLEYLTEDRGELSKVETEAVVTQLQDYFMRQINSNFVALLAEDDGNAIATVYMAVAEKPANPAFITGKTATILNVFTYPDYRRKGIATRLLKMTIDEAKAMNISYLELSATNSGKPLYEKLGFINRQSKYTEMRMGLL
jgi:GNAT superfamily N-acetyltransferase